MFADPAEVVALRKDTSVEVKVLDLRSEHEFNLFHVGGARRVDPAALDRPEELKPLLDQAASTITFLAGNGEERALDAWKRLKAHGVPNLYVIEGGVNRWLALYPVADCVATRRPDPPADELGFRFAYATGSRLPPAWPELETSQEFRSPCEIAHTSPSGTGDHGSSWPEHAFTKRVRRQVRSVVKGGCG
jgi:rhodanese-related sulfurtransferase